MAEQPDEQRAAEERVLELCDMDYERAAATAAEFDRLRAELAETRAAGDALAFAVAPIERMGRGAPGSRLDVLITRAEEWLSVRGGAPAPAEPPSESSAAGEDDAEVWIPPADDCMNHQHEPCPHCSSRVFHHRTGRCGSCGRRPAPAVARMDGQPPADEPRAILPHDWARREALFLAREVVQYRGSQLEGAKLDQLAAAITTLDETVAEYRAARLTEAPAVDTAADGRTVRVAMPDGTEHRIPLTADGRDGGPPSALSGLLRGMARRQVRTRQISDELAKAADRESEACQAVGREIAAEVRAAYPPEPQPRIGYRVLQDWADRIANARRGPADDTAAPDEPEHRVTKHWDAMGGEVLSRSCSCGEEWTRDEETCPEDERQPDDRCSRAVCLHRRDDHYGGSCARQRCECEEFVEHAGAGTDRVTTDEIARWDVGRFGARSPVLVALKLAEEVGEVCGAVIKRDEGAVRPDKGLTTREDWTRALHDEIGDVAIALHALCGREDVTLDDLVRRRFRDDVALRTGQEAPAGQPLRDSQPCRDCPPPGEREVDCGFCGTTVPTLAACENGLPWPTDDEQSRLPARGQDGGDRG